MTKGKLASSTELADTPSVSHTQRLNIKILVMVYKSCDGVALSYVKEILDDTHENV